MDNSTLYFFDGSIYFIYRGESESVPEFQTRVANEIKTIEGKIINARFCDDFATLKIQEKN